MRKEKIKEALQGLKDEIRQKYKAGVKGIFGSYVKEEQKESSDIENDDMMLSAVIKKFEIIGEATKNIPQEIKQKHPDVP
ncbi:MAG: hypothetical protein QMD21_01715 [Candidatus Thermoplasmatota archaeon]|nr:hypothetical protein [Candidatus Thermoplasmatota archaeon]